MRTLLVTGAAGRIGAAFVRANAGRYAFRLTDLRRPEDASEGDWIIGDLSDPEVARAGVAGCDSVLHLAANPHPLASVDELLPANVISTYTVLQAALEAGARRFVFASTIQTVYGHPVIPPSGPDAAPRPVNLYGASKAWGEALCSAYSHQGLSCCVVRIGAVLHGSGRRWPRRPELAKEIVYEADAVQLLGLALDAEDRPPFELYYAFSEHPDNVEHVETARRQLGYRPSVVVWPPEQAQGDQ